MPTTAITVSIPGDSANKNDSRASRYTPAVTIVAAWINAETGVGPAIASGNHANSGTCADLPAAPRNSSRHTMKSSGIPPTFFSDSNHTAGRTSGLRRGSTGPGHRY